MKSKQLANVLIKIIGLYVCLCAIPSLVSALISGFMWSADYTPKPGEIMMRSFSYAIGCAVQTLVGLCLICQSQKLAGYWFKNEEE